MDNHPIPQDVTGFQFKLIGQMTVKQFAYLCAGIILSWIFFSSKLFILIRLPLTAFFAMFGFLLAFVPVEGRPMDTMIMTFIKALFVPNQYVYQKIDVHQFDIKNIKHAEPGVSQTSASVVTAGQPALQASTPAAVSSPSPTLHTSAAVQSFLDYSLNNNPLLQPQTQSSNNQDELQDELKKEKKELEEELSEVEKLKSQEKSPTIPASELHDKLLELEKKLEETLTHKEKLENELTSIQKKLNTEQQKVYIPSTKVDKEQTSFVQKLPKTMSKKSGMAYVPDDPNVIAGIVKDPRGNVLPNILVEVKDSEDNPVRAFKTNQIGQFASATALRNGTYTITFEDSQGKNVFDPVEITVNGEILDPIEITSHDQREELRKALFKN